MTKQLLIERAIAVAASGSALCESTGRAGYLVEGTNPRPGVLMTVKLPATTLDRKNENQRVYRRTIMDSAMQRAQGAFEERSLLSSVNEHPEEPYVTPGQASHIVTAAWCENDGYLWNRWDVLNTATGRDLAALIEAGAAIGVSIRGLGSQDNAGNILDDYEYLGTDCVGQPSAKIRTAPIVDTGVTESTRRSAPTPAAPVTDRNSSAMKNKTEATQYVRDASVLMANEGPVDAMRRIIRVEAALAECALPAAELVEAYSLLETCKTQLEQRGQTIRESGQPQPDLLAEAQRGFRAKLVDMANKFRAEREKFDAEKARSARRLRALEARVAALTERALRQAKATGSQKRVLQMSESARVRLHRENARLKVQYSAASDLAVRSAVETRIAVREAARAVARARKAAAAPAAPAAPAPAAPVRESRQQKLVRTDLQRERGVRPTAPARGTRGTAANRDGTTRIPNFI